jgi:hypothetical protein
MIVEFSMVIFKISTDLCLEGGLKALVDKGNV